jgi:hypothetical protein
MDLMQWYSRGERRSRERLINIQVVRDVSDELANAPARHVPCNIPFKPITFQVATIFEQHPRRFCHSFSTMVGVVLLLYAHYSLLVATFVHIFARKKYRGILRLSTGAFLVLLGFK